MVQRRDSVLCSGDPVVDVILAEHSLQLLLSAVHVPAQGVPHCCGPSFPYVIRAAECTVL